MDYDSKLTQARLDALETVVAVIARRDPGIQMAVRLALDKEYEAAQEQFNRPDRASLQQTVETNFPPSRDKDAERAMVAAYGALCSKMRGLS